MTLYKRKCAKEGLERYYDVFLAWRYNDKVYTLMVHPAFKSDYKLLLVNAKEIPLGEPIEKYV